MSKTTLIIGSGLSGLTAAALLAKRGEKVLLFEKTFTPGGSCGVFKRDTATSDQAAITTFDQGAAMLYGFGEKGFSPHRLVFNCLEEPIRIIKHDQLYAVVYKGHRIIFHEDLDLFAEELSIVFPSEKANIKRFYYDLNEIYHHVMVENPVFSSPDETDKVESLKSLLRHPVSYARFLSYMNKSARSLLRQYFKDPEIFKFFDKLTSTYCYATVEEAPAILAAVMFVDNHFGGSYYPAGSTLFLPGKLEKSIEENGGEIHYESEVCQILFDGEKPCGVEITTGKRFYGDDIIYSGTVWNLYGKLIDTSYLPPSLNEWARNLVPTYPSVVLYTTVDKSVIPSDTLPIEMLIGNPDQIDESEVTLYIMSIDDQTLCDDDVHTVIAIGPSFENWESLSPEAYSQRKDLEVQRILDVIEKRFSGFRQAVRYAELASPLTIERYTNKNDGAVAGPKQMLGQHMFKRLHIRSPWDTLFYCGESTCMGTGTPAVTVSGLTAANAILKKRGLEPFTYKKDMPNYVEIVPHPFKRSELFTDEPEAIREVMRFASECLYCEHPPCMDGTVLDVRGVNRRVSVGNFVGAKRLVSQFTAIANEPTAEIREAQHSCIKNLKNGKAVEVEKIVMHLINS